MSKCELSLKYDITYFFNSNNMVSISGVYLNS